MMSAAGRDGSAPTVADVFAALGEATAALGSLVSHLVQEEPALALAAAVGAGFIRGGGLTSPLGTTLMNRGVRAAVANLGIVGYDALFLSASGGEVGATLESSVTIARRR